LAGKIAVKQPEQVILLGVNPTYPARHGATLDLLVCGQDNKINMIEAEANEVPEAEIAAAFKIATAEIEKIQAWQKKIIAEIGKAKQKIAAPVLPKEVIEHFQKHAAAKFETAVYSGPGKNKINVLKDEWLKLVKEKWFASADSEPGFNLADADAYFETQIDELIHREVIERDRRPDGYHEVVTVLHTIGLADSLTFQPADSLELRCDVPGLSNEQNLAWQAARRLDRQQDVRPPG